MKRYPKYKNSGVPWLDNIPEHWEVVSVKRLARNQINVVQTGPFGAQLHASDYVDEGVPLILIRNVKNLIIDDSDIPKISEDKAKQLSIYRLEIGDIVFSRVGSIGRVALVTEREEGWMISGQMLRLRIKNPLLDKQYSIYAFSSDYVSIYISLRSLGSTRESINTDILRECILLTPPLSEQKAIARFLDRKLEQIDHFISNKQRLIELLKEQKTAIANRAVTKGLNSHAPMKHSGVEWLGGIPAHWEIIKLGRLCNVTKLTGFEYTKLWKTDPNGEIIALRGLNIKNNRLILDDVERISAELSNQLMRSKLFAGDIVFPCTGTLGHGALIEQDNKYHINQNIAKITPSEDINPNFLLYMLCCSSMQYQINRLNSSGLQPVLLIGTIRNLILQIPPRIEQNQIVNWLHTTTTKIDQAIAKVEKEIELIQEYRTTLISDAVTGKIDVRETSAVETTRTTAAI